MTVLREVRTTHDSYLKKGKIVLEVLESIKVVCIDHFRALPAELWGKKGFNDFRSYADLYR